MLDKYPYIKTKWAQKILSCYNRTLIESYRKSMPLFKKVY